jgi:ribosomal protein S18 acetylase RimI-like enzyme
VETSLARATTMLPALLPRGLETEGTWLLTVIDSAGSEVGTLWIGRQPGRPDVAYIFDILIDESCRGRGLGRATMLAAERIAADSGMTEIGLNVFGYNETARRLYASLGYRDVAIQMTKTLPTE